jgi:hypothetical protein
MSIESDEGHGNSPAAWTAVIIMLVAFALGTFFFWFDLPWLVLAAGVLAVLGLITGKVLAVMGYGVGGTKYASKAHN